MTTPKVRFGPADAGFFADNCRGVAATGPQGPPPRAADARALASNCEGLWEDIELWELRRPRDAVAGERSPTAPTRRRRPITRMGAKIPGAEAARRDRRIPSERVGMRLGRSVRGSRRRSV